MKFSFLEFPKINQPQNNRITFKIPLFLRESYFNNDNLLYKQPRVSYQTIYLVPCKCRNITSAHLVIFIGPSPILWEGSTFIDIPGPDRKGAETFFRKRLGGDRLLFEKKLGERRLFFTKNLKITDFIFRKKS